MSDEINSLERRLEVVKEVGDNRFPTVNQRKWHCKIVKGVYKHSL